MSAFISVALDDRILLMSDTAAIDGDGRLCALFSKAIRWNTPPMAVAVRGTASDAGNFLKAKVIPAISEATTFEGAIERIRSKLRWSRPQRSGNIALVAGVGSNGRPTQFVLTTGPSSLDVAPLVLHEMDNLVVCGDLDEDGISSAGLDMAALSRDPVRHGPAFFQAFRRPAAYPWSNGKQLVGVGGQLQLTTITATGCTWRTIAYWPDWLEKPIDPSRKFVPVMSALNAAAESSNE